MMKLGLCSLSSDVLRLPQCGVNSTTYFFHYPLSVRMTSDKKLTDKTLPHSVRFYKQHQKNTVH